MKVQIKLHQKSDKINGAIEFTTQLKKSFSSTQTFQRYCSAKVAVDICYSKVMEKKKFGANMNKSSGIYKQKHKNS